MSEFSQRDPLRGVLRSYYLAQGIYGLSLGSILPAYVLFFWSRGLNLFEIAVLASTFEASILLFELPTGAFADISGRRKSVVLSHLFQSLAGIIFIFSPGFWFFALGEVTQGFGETLKTGALEAWMVDNLRAIGKAEKQALAFAAGEKFHRLGLLSGILFGGFWARHFLSLLFLPFAIFHLAAVLYLLRFMPKDSPRLRAHSQAARPGIKEALSGGLKSITATRVVLLLVIFSLFIEFAGETVDQYYQIYLSDTFLLDPRYFSWMLIAASLAVILTVGKIIPKKPINKSLPNLLATIEAARVVTILVFALWGKVWIVVLAFVCLEVFKGWERPLLLEAINRHITSAQRATAISLFSLVSSGGEVVTGVVIGTIALALGLRATFLTGAMVLALGLFLFITGAASTRKRRETPPKGSNS